MIDVTNASLYSAALAQLQAYKASVGGAHRGRFVQIFLGLKFFQNQLPSMFSNQYVRTETLQQLLDDLYAKRSRAANNCVLMMFEGSYLARTGLVGPANKSAQNTWRNNFNIQKGIGCYAPSQDLASPTFLDQSRLQCKYLLPATPGSLAGARCKLSPSGSYRSEDHRKWLQIDVNGSGYSLVDISFTPNFVPYVAPNGHRIPVLPLIVALYHDASLGLRTSARQQLDLADFALDFSFTNQEFAAYFDASKTSPFNAALLQKFPKTSYTTGPVAGLPAAPPLVAGKTITYAPKGKVAPPPVPQPVLSGTPAPPPGVNTGWDAEQYVESALKAANWVVYNVSRQRVGFDLVAQRGANTRLIDVKSSLSKCTPTLTAREWQLAQAKGAEYCLAILEDFNPTGQNVIFWVPDPARAQAKPVVTSEYSITRSWWSANTVPITTI